MNKSPVDGISDERLAELIAQWHDYATDPFALDTAVALRELSARRETGMVPREPVEHRACIAQEHDPARGKVHGCCVVCGLPWPCPSGDNERVLQEYVDHYKGKCEIQAAEIRALKATIDSIRIIDNAMLASRPTRA